MNRVNWRIPFGIFLLVLTVILHFVHYLIFRDVHHVFIYFMGDIAFIPMEVLLVALIIDQVLKKREKQAILDKLNMVIGAFFAEVGTELLKTLLEFDHNLDKVRENLIIRNEWTKHDFKHTKKSLGNYKFKMDSTKGDLASLKAFLSEKRIFLLRLLENPTLLEHESFTKLLWAVFHLADELNHREDTTCLPESDCEHLSGDLKRVQILLTSQWLDYMRHLQKDYPYLFSLALRTNPFDPAAKVEVT